MPLQPTPNAPISVIVADDDDDMRALVAATLRGEGHSVSEVADGEELLLALEGAVDDPTERPDIIVCDVKMPKLSGLGVLKALHRAHLPWPVVLMTVLGDQSIDTVARSLGAVCVLRKPFDINELRTALDDAVAHRVPLT
jgi:CheY-like chemotaxis protein